MQARKLSSGAKIGVAEDDKGFVIEATVTHTSPAIGPGGMEMRLIFTEEYDFPFAVAADRDIQVRNG